MAFFLTPRFVPAQQCGPFACAPSRPIYRRPAPAAVPSFVPFLSQVEELLGEIDREARRAAHIERQQRKRIFRARFDVRENNNGYEVEGELPGFEQENINIEVTDEYTLKVAGKQASKAQEAQPEAPAAIAAAEPQNTTETTNDKLDGATLAEPETDAHSDTSSHKSYQPTVEDDFEDLGAETSSTVSASSSSAPAEPKGKERAVEPVQQTSTPAPQQQEQPQDQELLSERIYGSFERNFRFPERIDAEGVRASLKNGVLSIKVPKAPVPAVRNITIQ